MVKKITHAPLSDNCFIKCLSFNKKHGNLLIYFHVHSFKKVSDGMVKGLTVTSIHDSRFEALNAYTPSIPH